MSAPYARTKAQIAHDFNQSKDFEAQVKEQLGEFVIDQCDSTTKIDFWVPGFYLDVKEKRQALTDRWWLLDGVEERDLFILDELGTRKLLHHYPYGYFLLRDVPGGDRLFLASCVDLACVDRARVDRNGKAKLVYNMNEFRRIGSVADVYEMVMLDLVHTPWKQSGPVGQLETPEVKR